MRDGEPIENRGHSHFRVLSAYSSSTQGNEDRLSEEYCLGPQERAQTRTSATAPAAVAFFVLAYPFGCIDNALMTPVEIAERPGGATRRLFEKRRRSI